jgi:hypothetical protein
VERVVVLDDRAVVAGRHLAGHPFEHPELLADVLQPLHQLTDRSGVIIPTLERLLERGIGRYGDRRRNSTCR